MLLPMRHRSDLMHLHILLTSPSQKHPDKVLIANLSSFVQGVHEESCILEPGDHPFIKHRSYIPYNKAKIFALQNLRDGIAQGLYRPRDPVGHDVFKRICNGLEQSTRVALGIKKFYMESLND